MNIVKWQVEFNKVAGFAEGICKVPDVPESLKNKRVGEVLIEGLKATDLPLFLEPVSAPKTK
tara:strand:+ start:413 stop:598 length:186 start_codon:yes stop_codon:yes gene_type:complete